ncbi:hypothetical protein [Nocardioides ganghwensis]|jgi:hypothetical protein|uniref:Uncharacterized protein n=1 Tax=Nocardioides ganghwensis TaxID=252230 RepID=A0A4Q2SB11_9ACTN|nr:hypothetical protein [Nocardioides ganghwensis]RYB98337.1 hypothetical protein EUA07_18515 [Nocardioides ganghwensis]
MDHIDVDRPSRAAGAIAGHPRGMTLPTAGDAGTPTLSLTRAELVLLALHLAQRTARVRPESRKAVVRLERRLDHLDLAVHALEALARWWCGM